MAEPTSASLIGWWNWRNSGQLVRGGHVVVHTVSTSQQARRLSGRRRCQMVWVKGSLAVHQRKTLRDIGYHLANSAPKSAANRRGAHLGRRVRRAGQSRRQRRADHLLRRAERVPRGDRGDPSGRRCVARGGDHQARSTLATQLLPRVSLRIPLNRVRLPIRLLEFVTNALRSWGVHAGRAARQLHGQQRHHTKHSVKKLFNGDNPKGDNPHASDDHRDT